MDKKIPRCMSTQHPDNVNKPFFSENFELTGEDEITETYYAFSHLGCDEQMWDYEGKEVDNYVIKKLLTKYEQYFSKNVIGKDVFLTLRVPNPNIEKNEAKILLETLESIPRSYDTAKIFYKKDIAPIFEVIHPMTCSTSSLNRIYWYYRDFVIDKQNQKFRNEDITISEWIGEFKPCQINVIPLFEDYEHILAADSIIEEYIKDKDVPYMRAFLARSDPAMNYGFLSAVLLNKIALQRFYNLSEKIGKKIYPIIGVGSAPFRGNLKPSTVERVLKEYPSVQTYTIQSAFKFDNPPDEVRSAISKIMAKAPGMPQEINEDKALEFMKKYIPAYKEQIKQLAGVVNEVAKFIPRRRKRKLHIGLFGYSREMDGIKLPRVISFTAALYSIGVPPEILGLNVLTKEDLRFLKTVYVNFEEDLADALKYINIESKFIPGELKQVVKTFDFQVDEDHLKFAREITQAIENKNYTDIQEKILQAANLRHFLG